MSEHIYKIMALEDWATALVVGIYEGSAHDRRDGFIHYSTAAQAAETAAKHFAGQADLVLLTVEVDALGSALKWEPSRGGGLFPHLYAAMPVEAVVKADELPLDEHGIHRFPPGF